MTALGIGTFSVKDIVLSPIVAWFATGCSFLWFRTNLGSKFWQESWEIEVGILAKDLGIKSFERSTSEVVDQVSKSLNSSKANSNSSPLRRWIDRETIKKPSVTYHMIILSLFSTLIWATVATVFSWRLLEKICNGQHWCFICTFVAG
jgi:hypothetical protein